MDGPIRKLASAPVLMRWLLVLLTAWIAGAIATALLPLSTALTVTGVVLGAVSVAAAAATGAPTRGLVPREWLVVAVLGCVGVLATGVAWAERSGTAHGQAAGRAQTTTSASSSTSTVPPTTTGTSGPTTSTTAEPPTTTSTLYVDERYCLLAASFPATPFGFMAEASQGALDGTEIEPIVANLQATEDVAPREVADDYAVLRQAWEQFGARLDGSPIEDLQVFMTTAGSQVASNAADTIDAFDQEHCARSS